MGNKAGVTLMMESQGQAKGLGKDRTGSGAYRILAEMTQVVAPNKECDQLPILLQVDLLRGQRS